MVQGREGSQTQREEEKVRETICFCVFFAFYVITRFVLAQMSECHHNDTNSVHSRTLLLPSLYYPLILTSPLPTYTYPRVLTGAGWNQITDPVTFIPFWYNDDTGEANYARPKIIEERYGG